jgi:hypothetical protein
MALNQALKDAFAEAGVTDDHFAKLEEVFTDEELQQKLAGGYMKNKAFTEKTQALAVERKKLEDDQKAFNEGQDYLGNQMNSYKADMEKRLNDALAQVQASSLRGAALETKLRTLAATYGEDPAELLADVKAAREEAKDKPTGFDYGSDEFKKNVVGRDEFKSVANAFASYPTQVRDFEREYQRTFGKEYEGSLTELVNTASKEVEAARARGQNVDLFGHIRTKLDFDGQKARNAETATAAAAKEKEDWQKQTREEIERDVRSKVLAENPNAYKGSSWEKPEAWRQNLGAAKRENKMPTPTAQDDFQRRVELHQKFEDVAAKQGVGVQ